MATPASRRSLHYHDAETASSPAPRGTAASRLQELPPYQPQVAELNATAQRAIQNLNRGVNLKHLSTHLAHASGALTGNAGEVNDRLTEAKARYEKSRKRLREKEIQRRNAEKGRDPGPDDDGDDDDASLAEIGRDEAAEKKIEEMEKTVREITAKMELGMRRIVDMEVDVDAMKDILQKLAQSSREEASSSQAKRRRVGGDEGGMRRLRGGDDDDEEDGNEDEEPEANDDDSAEEDGPEIVPASHVWSEKLDGHKQEWEALPMAQRYETNSPMDYSSYIYIPFN